MEFESITSEQYIYRKITPEVFDFIFINYSDEEVKNFLGLKSFEKLEIEKSKYQKGLSTFNKSFLYFHIIEKVTEEVIGWCGFHTWYLDHARAEIGYELFDDNYRNKGIMTEAMGVILNYGFTKMKLNRIEAFIGTQNIPSLILIKKYGFTKEGTLRSHYCKNNIMEDSEVYSLLRIEYNQ